MSSGVLNNVSVELRLEGEYRLNGLYLDEESCRDLPAYGLLFAEFKIFPRLGNLLA